MVSHSAGSRRGFTLVEILVVFAIWCILVALMVPALMSARRSASQLQCQNSLKQIGLAFHTYQEFHGVLPSGRVVGPDDGQGRCWSAYSQILPHLEQSFVFASINFDLDSDESNSESAAANRTAMDTRITTFLCPSDSAAPLPASALNYPLCTGTTYPVSTRNPGRVPVTGVFFENSSIRLGDITDGASQTVLASETIRSDPAGGRFWDGRALASAFVLTRGGDDAREGPELTNPIQQCRGEGLSVSHTQGSSWLFAAPGVSLYNHIRPPNDPQAGCRGGLPSSSGTRAGWDRLSHDICPRSRHPNGVNVLLADGSVRFIRDDVDRELWRALGSRGSGDLAAPAR